MSSKTDGNEDISKNNNNDNNYNNRSHIYDNSNFFTMRNSGAYSFSGRVVIGIGIILAVAAASTIYAMTVSVSPQIHLSRSNLMSSNNGKASANDQGASSSNFALLPSATNSPASAQSSLSDDIKNQNVDKKFVLIQNDFGWNGTTGGPAINVYKGDIVQITIINAGQMAHNFGIGKLSKETTAIMNNVMDMPLPDRVKKIPYNVMAAMPCPGCTPKFEQGHIELFMKPDTQQVTIFKATEAGNFKYFCMVRGHLWLGMIGDFNVFDTSSSDTSNSDINSNIKQATKRTIST